MNIGDAKFAKQHVLKALETDLEDIVWAQAAGHLGRGLEKGTPERTAARKVRKMLIKD